MNYAALESLRTASPVIYARMRSLERALSRKASCSRDELRTVVGGRDGAMCDPTYLQRIVSAMNYGGRWGLGRGLYGGCDDATGKHEGCNLIMHVAGRRDRYTLRHRDHNLAFPEDKLDAADRRDFNRLLRVAAFFDGAVPMKQLLGCNAGECLDSDLTAMRRVAGETLSADAARCMSELYNAIERRQNVAFRYSGSDIEVSPYLLRRYNNKWYLLAHRRRSPYEWSVFTLRRIEGIVRALPDGTYHDTDTSAIAAYYENVMGFDVPSAATRRPDATSPRARDLIVADIRLAVAPALLRYIEENPLHASQHTNADGTLSLRVVESETLYQRLLAFGAGLRVIAPESVRREMSRRLREALRAYGE